MKKHCAVFSAVLVLLFCSCSIFHQRGNQNIIGTWAGKAVIASRNLTKEYEAKLVFREDMTMTLTYMINGKAVTLAGKYTADLSRRPVRIDIRDYGFPKSKTTYCCLAIAEFPKKNTMYLSGMLGECGKITRPTEINRNPANHRQLNLELTRTE
jgi:hypothetical protein